MSKLHYNATAPTVVDGTTVEMQSDAAGNLKTAVSGGSVASGATDSGNPIKVGGVYNSTLPTNIATGERADFQTDRNGNIRARIIGSSVTLADGVLASRGAGVMGRDEDESTPRILQIANYVSNGTTVDLQRANTDITVLASAARTATASSSDITNYNGRGAHIVINVTAVTSTPSVVFTVEGKDALSSAYYTILTSAAITGTGTTALTVYPGATAAASVAVSQILPRTWRVTATHGDADSITFSVGASVIL